MQRRVLRVKEPKKTGARSARARKSDQNPLVKKKIRKEYVEGIFCEDLNSSYSIWSSIVSTKNQKDSFPYN